MDPDRLFTLLDEFQIETPSWAYPTRAPRFGQVSPARAARRSRKNCRRATVHRYTGCCPSVPCMCCGISRLGVDAADTARFAERQGLRIG